MSSLIFRAAARVLMPLLLVFAMFLLLRGHNEPGGGFVAGLVVAVAFVLRVLAEGTPAAEAALLVHPRRLLAAGLLLALGSGLVPVALGRAFLTACWTEIGPPEWRLLVGTPLTFDVGVCFVVIGVVLTMTFDLSKD
ncbi:cation:proton antiporter [Sorangium cellulosum]|jgi:multicomponent Na+:H+ antiporter subunit B|uniref:Cation:proton antiporter n=1 Tax=Sorangium cellulosum TaxID=56 RepID=A0A4P2PVD2_SORCE|nr:Na+/H+ antiporter subunit B [Sorangium cellulosum]AUX20664.1 cation:proton antiporter [Sorangium cellulosum]